MSGDFCGVFTVEVICGEITSWLVTENGGVTSLVVRASITVKGGVVEAFTWGVVDCGDMVPTDVTSGNSCCCIVGDFGKIGDVSSVAGATCCVDEDGVWISILNLTEWFADIEVVVPAGVS